MDYRHPKYSHLTPDGRDHFTGNNHCVDCGNHLYTPHDVVSGHVLSSWRHYLWIKTPEVIATTEKGHTLEGVVAVPSRRVLWPADILTHPSFCIDCFPGHTESGCGGCGKEVDLQDEHSRCELLDKYANGINKNFRRVHWHISCLPEYFSSIRTLRDELHNKFKD